MSAIEKAAQPMTATLSLRLARLTQIDFGVLRPVLLSKPDK